MAIDYKPLNLGQGFPDYPPPQYIMDTLSNVAVGEDYMLHQYTRGFLKILNLSDGKCSAELKVEEEHLSPWDTLHGGMSALLLDNISTWALQTHKNADDVKAAVSVEINMTFIKAAKEGEEIQIDANTLRAGKSLAFLEMFIRNKSTGELLVKGGQTKYLVRRQ
nr:acyl-coenzyme A thioesterase 13-like [Leptinotarsa decemlineata]